MSFFKLSMHTICLLFSALCCWVTSLEGATLHVVIVADMLEGVMSYGTECSVDMTHRQARRIAAYTGMGLEVALFEGYHTTQKNVLHYLNHMQIAAEDCVLLCFFLHGGRQKAKISPWPNLHFPMEQNRPDFGLFVQVIKDKNPRLLIALADACNGIEDQHALIDDEEDEEDVESYPELYTEIAKDGPSTHYALDQLVEHYSATVEDEDLARYRKLFVETAGSLVVTSSSPGQVSSRDPHLMGGLYTAKLWEALREQLHSTGVDAVSWQSILELATAKLTAELPRYNIAHTPQYEMSLQ